MDCLYGEELKYRIRTLQPLVKKLKVAKTRKQKAALKADTKTIKLLLNQTTQICRNGGSAIQTTKVVNLVKSSGTMGAKVRKALKVTDRNFKANKKTAARALTDFLKLLR